MLKITTWKTSVPNDEKWNWWNNVYFFDSVGMSKDAVRSIALGCVEFETPLHRNDTSYPCVTAVDGWNESQPDDAGTHYTFLTTGYGSAFARPSIGESKYRYKLGVHKQLPFGKNPSVRYTNCLNDEDFYRDEKGNIALKAHIRKQMDDWIALNQSRQEFWFREISWQRNGPFGILSVPIPVDKRYGAYVMDAHALTRWRQRISEMGINMFKAQRGVPILIEKAIVENEYWLHLGSAYIYEGVYLDTIRAINQTVKAHTDLKDFLKDADGDNNNGEEKPITRNGSTGAKQLGALSRWKSFSENLLPEIQKLHYPHPNIDGRSYISPQDLEVYQDILKQMQGELSYIWEYDFFNPYLYSKNQEGWTPFNQNPDSIELGL